jgi:hypothetical protein
VIPVHNERTALEGSVRLLHGYIGFKALRAEAAHELLPLVPPSRSRPMLAP